MFFDDQADVADVGGFSEFLDLYFVGLLTELNPHGITHEFGQCTFAEVFSHIVIVDEDVFSGVLARIYARRWGKSL